MFFLFIARKSIKGFLAVAALCAHRPWAVLGLAKRQADESWFLCFIAENQYPKLLFFAREIAFSRK